MQLKKRKYARKVGLLPSQSEQNEYLLCQKAATKAQSNCPSLQNRKFLLLVHSTTSCVLLSITFQSVGIEYNTVTVFL